MSTYVSASFAAANGTALSSYTPGTGTGFTLLFGAGSELQIQSNRLRHVAPDTGSSQFYVNDALPSIDFAVQCVLRFASSSFCELELSRSNNPSGLDVFCSIDFFAAGNANLTTPGGGSADLSPVLVALNTDYLLRIEFATSGADTEVTYKIDGVTITTHTFVGDLSWFDGTLSANMFESAGVPVLGIDDLLIEDITVTPPPSPPDDFWTSFVGSHEVP